MKRVLVTGATGFLGANLVESLIEAGHEVHLLVRDGYQRWRVKHLLPHVQLFNGDLLDEEKLSGQVKSIRPEWIFHLAAYGAYSWQDDLNTVYQTNLHGTINLVEACKKIDFETFINTGSSSEYGPKKKPSSETDQLEPNSYYAITKASATMFCRYTAQRFELPIFTLRPYSVYGPFEQPGRLIPTLIVKGLQAALPTLVQPNIARDYIHCQDVTNAYLFVASISAGIKPGDVINVGTGVQTRLSEVIDITREIFQINALPVWGSMENRPWDTEQWVADNAKLCSLGWVPAHDFRSGYLRTINWFKENQKIVDEIYRKG